MISDEASDIFKKFITNDTETWFVQIGSCLAYHLDIKMTSEVSEELMMIKNSRYMPIDPCDPQESLKYITPAYEWPDSNNPCDTLYFLTLCSYGNNHGVLFHTTTMFDIDGCRSFVCDLCEYLRGMLGMKEEESYEALR